MRLPFTPDEFFAVFADYNRAFWPVALVFWIACVLLVVLCRRDPRRWSRAATAVLGALWLWNAAAYHALLFTRINPAAWLFAALFAAEGALLLREAARGGPQYLSGPPWLNRAGLVLAGYALVYPLLNLALGHEYPGMPTFGVPCPTAILTIGMLLTVRGGVPVMLSAVPLAWSAVGGSAAIVLGVRTDFALLLAGAVLLAVTVRHARARQDVR